MALRFGHANSNPNRHAATCVAGSINVTITCVRGAAWAVVWDASSERHAYRTDVDVVFQDDSIIAIEPSYPGPVDVEIDGGGRMVMPGLINVHSHPSSAPMQKGFREEFGNPQMHMSPLYDRAFMLQTNDAGARCNLQYTVAELLMSGVTSVVDLSFVYEGWLDAMAATGIRAWLVPSYASAHWSTKNGHSVDYIWDEPRGERLLDEAIAFASHAQSHTSGRMGAMLGPAQIDTCTEGLLRTSLEAATEHGWQMHTHASQSVVEFYEMTRRHGKTPIQWANDIGLLGPNSILAHAIFTDDHHSTHWPGSHDRSLLAESGTGVAHCPGVFARNGQVLEDLGGYVRAGVRVGIGTDSFPHNMLEEMRQAAIFARIATGDVGSVTTAEVFHAATVGGADLVGRTDVGRLRVGAKADIVLIDLTHPTMMPMRDPLRSLIYTAADRAVCDVFVDGDHVVANGEIRTIDVDAVASELEVVRDQAEAGASAHHFAGKTAREVAPLTLPMAD